MSSSVGSTQPKKEWVNLKIDHWLDFCAVFHDFSPDSYYLVSTHSGFYLFFLLFVLKLKLCWLNRELSSPIGILGCKISLKDCCSGMAYLACCILMFLQFRCFHFTFLIYFFTHGLLRSVLFSVHMFGNLTEIFLLLLCVTWILNGLRIFSPLQPRIWLFWYIFCVHLTSLGLGWMVYKCQLD